MAQYASDYDSDNIAQSQQNVELSHNGVTATYRNSDIILNHLIINESIFKSQYSTNSKGTC